MEEVIKSVSILNLKLDVPIQSNIKYFHHFHKGLLVALIFFALAGVSLYGWIRSNNLKDQFEANDIKYRFLKINGGAAFLKITHDTDSLYNLNTNGFTSKVVEATHLNKARVKTRFNLKPLQKGTGWADIYANS